MGKFIIRRMIIMVPVLLLVSMIAFSIILLLPGDPALAILGEELARDKQLYQALRDELGLDRPIPVQYADWLFKALRGNLGISVRNRQPIVEAIAQHLPPTLELSFIGMIIALIIAVPVGIISAVRPNSIEDMVGTIIAMVGVAVPHFWLGILFIYAFAVYWRLLPPSGYVNPMDDLGTNLKLMVMPAFTLGLGLGAVVMRQIRSSLIEVMQQEYITTARAKGLRENVVVTGHALKNALIPVVTVIGLQVGRLFGGAVVTETIFSIPGAGRLAVDSIYFRDFPVVQAVILVMAVAVLICNLAADVLYAYIDPRIRFG
ncbi:MAG: ABC transporter permease [Actinobacteria bacterium]|nr:ABC transporter permease [Actinomycetota bacterium]MCL5025731.1 ABC transporter permease [Chloroflexota bacterium]